MARVLLDDVCFRYPVYEATGRSMKMALMSQFVGGRLGVTRGVREVEALVGVTLELQAGDRLGLIGRNGSGKSTLLRLLAGLAYPQSGRMEIEGRVIPLIVKGLGVNPELSGYDNIELPLRLLGATSQEIKLAKADIPEFTGLGNFINLPVRMYSEGMRTRLAFAICTAVAGDVLILDEWLGAGDQDFYNKAQARLAKLLENTRIVVLASHSNELIKQVCNKAAWLDRGRLVMTGYVDDVVDAYKHAMTRYPAAFVSHAA